MGKDRKQLLHEMRELRAHTDVFFQQDVFGHSMQGDSMDSVLAILKPVCKQPSDARGFFSAINKEYREWNEHDPQTDAWKYVEYVTPDKLYESLQFLFSLESALENGRAVSSAIYAHAKRVLDHVEVMKEDAEANLADNDQMLEKIRRKKPEDNLPMTRERLDQEYRMSIAMNRNPETARDDYCIHRMEIEALQKLAHFALHVAKELEIPNERRPGGK